MAINAVNEALNNFQRFSSGQDRLSDRADAAVGAIPGDNRMMDVIRSLLGAQLRTGAGVPQGIRNIGSGLGKSAGALFNNPQSPVPLSQAMPSRMNELGAGLSEAAGGVGEMTPALLELFGGKLLGMAGKGLGMGAKSTPKAAELATQIAKSARNRDAAGRFSKLAQELGQHPVNVANRGGMRDVFSKFNLPDLY